MALANAGEISLKYEMITYTKSGLGTELVRTRVGWEPCISFGHHGQGSLMVLARLS